MYLKGMLNFFHPCFVVFHLINLYKFCKLLLKIIQGISSCFKFGDLGIFLRNTILNSLVSNTEFWITRSC